MVKCKAREKPSPNIKPSRETSEEKEGETLLCRKSTCADAQNDIFQRRVPSGLPGARPEFLEIPENQQGREQGVFSGEGRRGPKMSLAAFGIPTLENKRETKTR